MKESACERPAPNLFLVGAPKCGTTSLYEYLRQHPAIYFPFDEKDYARVKEPNHFCPELEILESDAIKDRCAYLDLYGGSAGARWRGDASTNHLFSATAAERIKEFCPDARILIMLRPPLEQMRSYHNELVRHHHEDILDFHEALEASEDRRNRRRIPQHTGVPRCLDYLAVARFAGQVERYFQVFGRDKVKVTLLEDLVADPAATFRGILSFLNVEASFRPEFKVHNETPRNGLLERIATSVYAVPLARSVFGAAVSRPFRRGILAVIRRIDQAPHHEDPRDEQLRRLYVPEVKRLAVLIGRNLDHWQPQ